MSASCGIAERRTYSSRRTFSWRTVLFGHLHSHRRVFRRAEDADSAFIDWHGSWLFFLALGIMLLSCVDAFMTLQLIERGMIEVNPVMATVMRQGTAAFAISKLAMTGISILILVFLSRTQFMRFLRTGLLLTIFFSAYCCLICYQFVHLLQSI